MESERIKFKKFKRRIEIEFLSKFNPVVAFLIKYKLKNKEIIDLFDKYDYLTPEFIQNKLKKRILFPSYDYNADCFSDFNINIFEIPYDTLLKSSKQFLYAAAPEEMNKIKLDNFLREIFKLYNFVPYHNFSHGACVMQLFQKFTENNKQISYLFNPNRKFLGYIAALCHDNSHLGKNNKFLVKKNHQLAYNVY